MIPNETDRLIIRDVAELIAGDADAFPEGAAEALERVAADPCGCDIDAGLGPCTWCYEKAEAMIGKRIRDDMDREWTVSDEIDSKNGMATLSAVEHDMPYWTYADSATVLEPAGSPDQ
jgi:hypothetical protein